MEDRTAQPNTLTLTTSGAGIELLELNGLGDMTLIKCGWGSVSLSKEEWECKVVAGVSKVGWEKFLFKWGGRKVETRFGRLNGL